MGCRSLAALMVMLAACGGEIDPVDFTPVDAAPDAPPPRPASMVVSPPPGAFTAPPSVTITIDDPDDRVGELELWYTLDGSTPVPGTSMQAQPGTPITLDRSRGLRVFATDHGAVRFAFAGTYLVLEPNVATFSSNLPVLVMWGEVPAPETKLPNFTPSSMTLFVPPPGGRAVWPGPATDSVRAGLKVRGSSTASYPKHPYHVESRSALVDGDEKLAMLGMPADSDWALNAPLDFDRALMRNSLAYALSNAIERWAPRTEFAEVFVAGGGETVGMDDYVGVYEVTEMIMRSDSRVDIAKIEDEDITEPAISGGYIFKEDRLGPGEGGWRPSPGTAGNTLVFHNNFVLVDPEENDAVAVQRMWLKAYTDEVAFAVTSPTFTGPSGKHYRELIDVDAFIDHHIINVFTKNPDAFRLSGYYYKDRSGPLAQGPVWDFDRTMGCASDGRAADPMGWGDTGGTGFFVYGFYGGLFKDPEFRARYWARLGQLLKGPLSPEAIEQWVDPWGARLTEAAARNFTRWSNYQPRGGYTGELNILKTWLASRAAWMTMCLQRPDPRMCP